MWFRRHVPNGNEHFLNHTEVPQTPWKTMRRKTRGRTPRQKKCGSDGMLSQKTCIF